MIRTKIVATLGPATASPGVLDRLLEESVDVCRLNFSHGELSEHQRTLSAVREAVVKSRSIIAVLGDLCGPKIRLGKIADQDGSGGMPINVGDVLRMQRKPIVGADGRVSTTYEHFVDDVAVGDRILIEDGLLRFIAVEKTADDVACACTAGGVLKTGKGINLPNTHVRIPSITARDWECVDWAIANEIDYLALSFVRRADELLQLRARLAARNSDINIIAKIEKAEALQHIDEIIDASDGLMVARGDLGVEMDVARVPIIQKDLIRRCQVAGKPCIVATQMLQSMIEQTSPTRAEVSDVANAIFDGADAVMLSGETSVGKYPAAAAHIMSHIAEITEGYLAQHSAVLHHPPVGDKSFSSAMAHGVWEIAHDLAAKAVIVWSHTGGTARIFSKYRFPIPILAPCDQARSLNRMALNYGVVPLPASAPANVPALVRASEALVREGAYAADGDRVIIIAGSSMGAPLTISGIVVHTIGGATERKELEKR